LTITIPLLKVREGLSALKDKIQEKKRCSDSDNANCLVKQVRLLQSIKEPDISIITKLLQMLKELEMSIIIALSLTLKQPDMLTIISLSLTLKQPDISIIMLANA